MSRLVLLLVEGPTEERFVKDVLATHFEPMGLYFQPTVVETKVVKDGQNFKGGVSKFTKIERDLRLLIRSRGDALVTTLFDYYGLPSDTPGMATRDRFSDPFKRVEHVEQEIWNQFGKADQFRPFLTLHEFEALLFSCPNTLPEVLVDKKRTPQFAAICQSVVSPEHINERPESAPSVRIKDLYPSYQKTLHGPTTAKRIGLDLIRSKCHHFNAWIEELEQFARS